jgi:hypothetical protein
MLFVIRKASHSGNKEILSYGIITSPAEGVATQNAANGQIHSAYDAIAFYRLKGIVGTCRFKPTTGREQRRDKVLVYPDQAYENVSQQVLSFSFHFISFSPIEEGVQTNLPQRENPAKNPAVR